MCACIYIYIRIYICYISIHPGSILGVHRQEAGTMHKQVRFASSLLNALTTTPGRGTFPIEGCSGRPIQQCRHPRGTISRSRNCQEKHYRVGPGKTSTQYPGVATQARCAEPRRVAAPRLAPTSTVAPGKNIVHHFHAWLWCYLLTANTLMIRAQYVTAALSLFKSR